MKHANLSVFVPHEGCPERCVFCDQRAVSGAAKAPSPEEVTKLCDAFLPAPGGGENTEIAFFGGSFTAIERGYMTALLEAAYPFVEAGRAFGIRISTRPDAVGEEVLKLLWDYGVTSVELGAQSMDDGVLAKNRRGHTAGDVAKAAKAVREAGFSLGLQMMLGMYGDTAPHDSAVQTAEKFIALSPDTVRIYPTLVLKGTVLERLFLAGDYTPLKLEEAAAIAGELLRMFADSGVRVIRTGLHGDGFEKRSVTVGPFHPAFGDLAENWVFGELIRRRLLDMPEGGYAISVAPGRVGAATGQHRSNTRRFAERGYKLSFLEDGTLRGYEIRVKREEIVS